MKKKVLYVHGLASTRNSSTAGNLRKYLPDYEVVSFDVPFDPPHAIEYVYEASQECDLIIGSSLGGFYSQFGIPDIPRILINPALQVADNIYGVSGYGTYEYFEERTDGVQTFETTPEYYEKLRECEKLIAQSLTDKQIAGTRVIFGESDEVLGDVNVKLGIERYGAERIIMTEMLHRVSEECVRDIIVPLVEELIG